MAALRKINLQDGVAVVTGAAGGIGAALALQLAEKGCHLALADVNGAGLAEVASKHPQVLVCLLSALAFHGLTTQAPFEVWVAVDNKARAPQFDYPPLRVARFSGPALTEGVAVHDIEGISVKVTSVAKTIADCFKFRNKIGLDVALEALKEAWHAKRVTMDELWHFGQICRVQNVMRPYLEGLTA